MEEKRSLAIWGIGKDATTLISRFTILNICADYFIDSNCQNEDATFNNRRVLHPKNVEWSNPPYVIVATRNYYNEVSEFLKDSHLEEGEDFTGYLNAYYAWLGSLRDDGIIKRVFTLQNAMKQLETWIMNLQDKIIKNNSFVIPYLFRGATNVMEVLLQSVCNDEAKLIELKGNVQFEYSDIKDLAVIVEELLLNEDYYFKSVSRKPLIIDGGANVGLAIYYFKMLYPESHIIAFEPVPQLFEVIQRNVRRNQWKGVEVYPYALDGKDMENTVFYTQASCLAGSLGKRNMEGVDHKSINEIKVQSVCLSDYIQSKVDYLKLDIEGSETRVIDDIKDKLNQIDHIFVEYHEGKMKEDNSIARIANYLEDAGFDINIGKSSSSANISNFKPMEYVGKRLSEVIWAKKKVIISQCIFYEGLNLLRINASCTTDEISKISVYIDGESVGDFVLNIYVNDEITLRGSELWNCVFTKVMQLRDDKTVDIMVFGKKGNILYKTTRDIFIESNIPLSYISMIGKKEGLTINDNTDLDYYEEHKRHCLKPGLQILSIETSSICNFRCKYCLVGNNYESIERSVIREDVFEEVINIINRMPSIQSIQLNALGEPLTNPKFIHICERIYNETSIRKIAFFTNGLLFDDKVADSLSKVPLDFLISISIDGHSPEENDFLRVGSDYKAIKNNIYNFLSKIVNKANFRIRINNLLIDEQEIQGRIPEFLLNDFGFLYIDSHRTFYFPDLSFSKLENDQIFVHAYQKKKVCIRCFRELTVRFNGDVIRCHWDSNCDEIMGNILDKNLEDIWWGEKYIEMRKKMSPESSFEWLPDSCKRCHAMNEGYLYKK